MASGCVSFFTVLNCEKEGAETGGEFWFESLDLRPVIGLDSETGLYHVPVRLFDAAP